MMLRKAYLASDLPTLLHIKYTPREYYFVYHLSPAMTSPETTRLCNLTWHSTDPFFTKKTRIAASSSLGDMRTTVGPSVQCEIGKTYGLGPDLLHIDLGNPSAHLMIAFRSGKSLGTKKSM